MQTYVLSHLICSPNKWEKISSNLVSSYYSLIFHIFVVAVVTWPTTDWHQWQWEITVSTKQCLFVFSFLSLFEWLNVLCVCVCVCHWRLNHHMSIDGVWSSCQSHEKLRTHSHPQHFFCSVASKGWRLFFVWCHWTFALCFAPRSIVQFIFNCYCHCCHLWIFRYTISQWSVITNVYASVWLWANALSVMSTRANNNNNVNDWERIKEAIHLFILVWLQI